MVDQPPGLKSPGRPFVVKIGEAVAPMMREHDPDLLHAAADAADSVIAGAEGAVTSLVQGLGHAIGAERGHEDAGEVGADFGGDLRSPYAPPRG